MKCSESVRVLKQGHLLHLKTLDNSFYRTVFVESFFVIEGQLSYVFELYLS